MTSTRDARAAGSSDARIAAATRIVAAPAMGSAPRNAHALEAAAREPGKRDPPMAPAAMP
jgi:hypothetical protein